MTEEVDVSVAAVQIGSPAILKTRRLGYDGKGQALVGGDGDTAAAWKELGEVPAILEGFIEFEREISVIAARGRDPPYLVRCTRVPTVSPCRMRIRLPALVMS